MAYSNISCYFLWYFVLFHLNIEIDKGKYILFWIYKMKKY